MFIVASVGLSTGPAKSPAASCLGYHFTNYWVTGRMLASVPSASYGLAAVENLWASDLMDFESPRSRVRIGIKASSDTPADAPDVDATCQVGASLQPAKLEF